MIEFDTFACTNSHWNADLPHMISDQHPTHCHFPLACTPPLSASATPVSLNNTRHTLLSVLHAPCLLLYIKLLNVALHKIARPMMCGSSLADETPHLGMHSSSLVLPCFGMADDSHHMFLMFCLAIHRESGYYSYFYYLIEVITPFNTHLNNYTLNFVGSCFFKACLYLSMLMP
jgi:hypothetical protein